MEFLLKDLRLAIRGLARSPVVVVVAVAPLAVSIALTTTVFSIVNATILQPLRYGHPERLVLVWMARRERPGFGNPPLDVYLAWRDRTKSFEALGALADTSFDLRGNPTVRIGAAEATADFFSAVEVQPVLGRVFTEEEARSGARVLVLSHPVWKNRFASDPKVLGRTILLSGAPWTVIGVMPQTFSFVRNHDLWIPLKLAAYQMNGRNALMVVGKLRDGVRATEANAELDAVQQEIIREQPDIAATNFDSARVMSLRDILVRKSSRRMMMLLLGAVGLVLLIACANAANLLSARGASRQKEIAVRVAVGATRSRIVQHLLAEAAVLSIAGAATGLLLSLWAVSYLATLPMLQAPGAPPVSIDLSVLAFAAGVTTLTLLASGVLSAWQLSHVSPIESLKCGSATSTGSTHHRRVRNTLVIAEVALSVVLLASAGLLLRRFVDLVRINPGFDASALLTMDISRTRQMSPESARNFYDQVLDRVRVLPGVESAAVSTTLPMVGWLHGVPFRRPDQPKEAIQRQFGILNVVSAGYFQTLRLPVIRGRTFNSEDSATSLPVVIIDEHLARRYFKNEDPIGKTLLIATPFDFKAETARQVVGIAGDVKDSGIEQPIADDVYLPFEQYPVPWEYLSVRSSQDPTTLTGSIRAAIASVDSDQPLEDIATMQLRVDESLRWSQFATNLLGGFAALSLLLAVGGMYGVIAYTTTQRTTEFGLRMALGARPRTLLAMVLTNGMKLVLAGSCIGISAALVIAHVLSSSVVGVNPRDPVAFMTTLVVIVSAALLAAWIPARRAARMDPMVALRHE